MDVSISVCITIPFDKTETILAVHSHVQKMFIFRYNIEQEQKLATDTTVLVESYTVSFKFLIKFIFPLLLSAPCSFCLECDLNGGTAL